MNIEIVNHLISKLALILFFYSSVSFCFAELPSKASYATSTTHNCAGYECTKSLYPQETLDIKQKNITQAQYEAIIEKHINSIQTTQTTYPGFGTTIKKKIPKNVIDKALHCHKAKAQKTNWNDSNNQTAILKYRHECWQLKVRRDESKSHSHRNIARISDITYTVKVTRAASACSSDLFVPHASEFKCIKRSEPEKSASIFRKSSLLALKDIPGNQFVKIKFDDYELKFVLLDVAGDLDFLNSINIPTNETPVAENTPTPTGNDEPEQPQPEFDDDDGDEPEQQNPTGNGNNPEDPNPAPDAGNEPEASPPETAGDKPTVEQPPVDNDPIEDEQPGLGGGGDDEPEDEFEDERPSLDDDNDESENEPEDEAEDNESELEDSLEEDDESHDHKSHDHEAS